VLQQIWSLISLVPSLFTTYCHSRECGNPVVYLDSRIRGSDDEFHFRPLWHLSSYRYHNVKYRLRPFMIELTFLSQICQSCQIMVESSPACFNWQRARYANVSSPFFCLIFPGFLPEILNIPVFSCFPYR